MSALRKEGPAGSLILVEENHDLPLVRVQLSLPGAEPAVEEAPAADAATAPGDGPAAADSPEGAEEDELEAAEAEPRVRGLVARGAGDDAD